MDKNIITSGRMFLHQHKNTSWILICVAFVSSGVSQYQQLVQGYKYSKKVTHLHEKYKRLKLGCGHVYDCSSV
jgi:hypothetical protein